MSTDQSPASRASAHISLPVDELQLRRASADARRARVALLTLVALSGVQVLMATLSQPAPYLAVIALLLAGWKCRCIARDFMDLRHVRGPWRPLLDGWLLLVLALLATSFLI